MKPKGLTHLDSRGRARMVDVGEKPVTRREALATGRIRIRPNVLALLLGGKLPKGDALAAARLAGIMAAKRVPEMIPLCHGLPLDSVEVELNPGSGCVDIRARARATARTGVEMEALAAVSASALTLYDMAKALDRGMVIERIRLEEKSGGRSGRYVRASRS